MTQKERLLNYLKLNTRINPLESWTKLGIYRLSAVVFDLRKEGHIIVTNRKAVNNQFGEECVVAEYELIPS
jgi:hypothetical protein